MIIKAGKIIVGKELEVKENAAIKIENGKITEIYDKVSEIPSEDPSEIVDYGDKTVIPGMIDCHNHLALDTRLENHLVKMNDCECEQTIRALKTMEELTWNNRGVTTSRCLGDRFLILMLPVKRHRRKAALLDQSWLSVESECVHPMVTDMWECLLMVRKNLEDRQVENILHGVDFLKVFMTKVINATPFIYHFMSPEVAESSSSGGKKCWNYNGMSLFWRTGAG